jgi:long-subunit fatty acid transport protein
MKKKAAILLLFFSIVSIVKAQTGGENIYEFLNLGSSASVAALGGYQIALQDPNADFAFYNPAALNKNMDQEINLNYVNYISDINYGFASYSKNINSKGNFAIGMHYVNYGKFTKANEQGKIEGDFSASDYALLITYSHQLNENWKIGATIKPIYSSLEKYNSLGIATDLALIYDSNDQLFRASIVARNFGYQIKPYYGSHREDLPHEILFGFSTKLQHAPFRFHLTYRHLEKFDLTYQSEVDKQANKNKSKNFGNKFIKHLIIGTEFLPSKNFNIRIGYNFQRREELKIDKKGSTVGFTWGFGLKISKFKINFASAKYHLAGSSNHFSISTSLSEFKLK